jgi:NTP pyrophosphatase (non-canonical NTP hydrolase)
MDSRELRFLADVMDEVHRARKLFPTNAALMVALMEEVGELAKAMLDESDDRVRAEAIQVAGLAMRVAIEGDSTLAAVRSAIKVGE